jgi:hypothetical protein
MANQSDPKTEIKVKATDMDPEEIDRVKEAVLAGLKESLKEQKQERVLSRYLKT